MFRSLRARGTLALAVIALTVLVVVVVATTSITRLGGAIATILQENYRSVVACEDMLEALERQDSAALFAATGHDDIARPMLQEHRAAFARALTTESRNITLPEEGPAVRALTTEYQRYVAAVDGTLLTPPGPARQEGYFRELLPRFTATREVVQRVLRMNQVAMEVADRRAVAIARRSVAVTFAVGAVALLLALGFAWGLPGALVKPVQRLAEAARAIGEGDLDVVIEAPGVIELAPLAEASRKMLVQLKAYRASSLGELLAAQDLANATVRCLLDPVVVCATDGSVLLANEAAERTFGLRPGDAEELSREHVSLPPTFTAARDRAVATGAPVAPRSFREAMRWRDRAGERYFLVRAAPLRAEGGGPPRALVIAQDVTRFRRIDDLKSDMVATVSHEFKTPLTSLRMATHLLLEPPLGPLTEAQQEVVETARDDTERLRALVDELLDLVRIEAEAGALRRVPVDPRRLLDRVAEAHQTIARARGVTLSVTPGPALALARVDPEKLGIVLANLVANAIRHTPSGGEVSLSAEDDGAALRLAVRDTGEGLPDVERARLLSHGTAARPDGQPSGGRRGLGLTIAQELVLQHGGELSVTSAAGAGTTFTVALSRDLDADVVEGETSSFTPDLTR